MNGLPVIAAVLLAQAPAPAEAPAERATREPPAGAAPAPTPAPDAAAVAPAPALAPAVRTEAAPAAPSPAVVTTTARRRRAEAAGGAGSTSTPTSTSTSTSTPTPTPTPTSTSTAAAPPRTFSGRDEAEHAARSFLDALTRRDANALAALASDRFSFDGDVQAGRETIRRTWRDLLIARPEGPQPAVGAVELVEAEEAAARFGKPPARIAPLVRRGVSVAIADVGGRTVVLFVAREGSRMAVLGFHD